MPTVLVGKKNLEVRPLAVNKGEIVKRILYSHPDAEFIFYKTDEDMFRALLFPQDRTPSLTDTHVTLDPPLSVMLRILARQGVCARQLEGC